MSRGCASRQRFSDPVLVDQKTGPGAVPGNGFAGEFSGFFAGLGGWCRILELSERLDE
jgi:hypothetical protein